jgi:hypothetical protein
LLGIGFDLIFGGSFFPFRTVSVTAALMSFFPPGGTRRHSPHFAPPVAGLKDPSGLLPVLLLAFAF